MHFSTADVAQGVWWSILKWLLYIGRSCQWHKSCCILASHTKPNHVYSLQYRYHQILWFMSVRMPNLMTSIQLTLLRTRQFRPENMDWMKQRTWHAANKTENRLYILQQVAWIEHQFDQDNKDRGIATSRGLYRSLDAAAHRGHSQMEGWSMGNELILKDSNHCTSQYHSRSPIIQTSCIGSLTHRSTAGPMKIWSKSHCLQFTRLHSWPCLLPSTCADDGCIWILTLPFPSSPINSRPGEHYHFICKQDSSNLNFTLQSRSAA